VSPVAWCEPAACALPAAPSASSRAAPLVLVTGGKGGVGKTSISANLALELGRRGARVLLVDLDLGLANLNVLLRANPPRHLEHWLAGEAELAQCLLPIGPGVQLLPGGSGTRACAAPDTGRQARLLAGIAQLAPHFDLVLADSAAGIGPDVLGYCAHADRVLLVSSPEPAALTDAYGLLKALDAYGREEDCEIPTPELVINFAGSPEEAERTAAKLRAVSERFLARSPRMAGWLPRSAEVQDGSLRQHAYVLARPEALASLCTRRLAERVARITSDGRAGTPR
jgi:flagellar biosynthesis protein FlhG